MNFAVLADHMVKLKKIGKRDKCLDFAIELKKKLWNMNWTAMPIAIGVLGTVIE